MKLLLYLAGVIWASSNYGRLPEECRMDIVGLSRYFIPNKPLADDSSDFSLQKLGYSAQV